MIPGLDLYYTDLAQHLRTAGWDLDDLSDLSDLSVQRVNTLKHFHTVRWGQVIILGRNCTYVKPRKRFTCSDCCTDVKPRKKVYLVGRVAVLGGWQTMSDVRWARFPTFGCLAW